MSSIGRTTTREYFKKDQGTMTFEPVSSTVLNINPSGKGINGAVSRIDAKSRCLTTNKGEGRKIIVPVGIGYRGRMEDGKWVKRYESNGEPKANALTTCQADSMVATPVACRCRGRVDKNGNGYAKYECREDGKANTLDTNTVNGSMVAEPIGYKVRNGSTIQVTENNIHGLRKNGATESESFVYFENGKTNALTTSHIPRCLVNAELCAVPDPCIYQTPHGFNKGGIKYEKSPTLTANGSWVENNTVITCFAMPVEWDDKGNPTKAISCHDGKTYSAYEVKDGQITIKGKQYPIKLADGYYIIRKLTVSECKRLQTVPDWYEFPVSDTQAYKMLGNGWTVEVIAHLINATQASTEDFEEHQITMFEMVGE